MTGDARVFSTFEPSQGNYNVKIADGSLSKVTGCGTVIISKTLTLQSVLYVPTLDCNLLSISKLTYDEKCVFKFFPTYCVFQDMISGKMIGTAEIQSGLYVIKAEASKGIQGHSTKSNNFSLESMSESMSKSNKENSIMRWHYRLGHPSFLYLEKLFPDLFLNHSPKDFHCDFCELSKHTRSVFHPTSYKASKPFALIHSDVWGPSRVPNITGAKWFVSFIDDHTRVTWVFLMKEKSEVTNIFKNFHSLIKNQFQTNIQVFRSDNGREFVNQGLREYLCSEGIVHQTSCVDTPQQNGISERKNRHLLEVTRSLLFCMRVPSRFWGEAVLTAVHLINRQPSRVLHFKSPCQTLLETYPHTKLISTIPLRVFGCTVFVHVQPHYRGKLDPRAVRCLFLGYSPTQKGYRCYNPDTRKIHISLDVTFVEDQPFFPQTQIQGGSENEFQFFDHSHSHVFHEIPHYESSSPNSKSHHPNVPEIPHCESNVSPSDPPDMTNKFKAEPVVYSRKPIATKDGPDKIVPQQDQESQPELVHISDPNTEPLSDPSTSPDTNQTSEEVPSDTEIPIALRRPVRMCRERPLYPLSKYISYEGLSSSYKTFAHNISLVSVPANIQEAMSIPEWKNAVLEELGALQRNKTWDITELPKGKQAVGCKWVFTVKHKADGSVERYKARLVAKGFTQTYGIDYGETFAPVAKLNTIRVLLSLAVNLNWKLHQMDVKNAFLNGELAEEVYMKGPPGLENDYGDKVCKLKKSLYGLKQSPRAWFERFTKAVKRFGYTQCQADHTLFVHHATGVITILIVYVDDIIMTGNSEEEIQKLKSFLAKEFEIKDLGSMKYFLGMEVARSKAGICINQRKYILDLLKETGMTACKPADTPMDYTTKLGLIEESPPVDKGRYQRLVGKLIYLSHTRPDIAFPVSTVSQFMNSPNEEHMGAVLRILRYLKMTPGQGICFKKSEDRDVRIFTDADWAGSVVDRRSTSGYCSYVWGNLVTWRSKKQSVVSRSSVEAEFRAMAHGICEGIWLQRLLNELKVPMVKPMELLCDNQATISIAKNPVHHDRTKHVEIDRHFIKEKIEAGSVKISYTPTNSQTADVFTKALPRASFEGLCSKLGMINIYCPA
ncbi:hypothetical protein ACOSP7_020624 [Xanthoceras sorbifolium]